MSVLDITNGVFEFGGACLLWLNVRRLWRDRKLAGVSLVPTIWFNAWGAWNLVYYFAIHQYVSWVAGMGVFVVNTTWVALALWFTSKREGER